MRAGCDVGIKNVPVPDVVLDGNPRFLKKVKRLKCGGCGAILEDSAAFQAHCSATAHGGDFLFDCEEIEVLFRDGETSRGRRCRSALPLAAIACHPLGIT